MESLSASQIARLLELARRGDREALGEVLEAYRRYLELLAKIQLDRKLKVRTSASDIVQDTFAKAAKGFGLFRGQSERELMAWLRKILASRLASAAAHHRAEKRNLKLEERLDAELDQTSQVLARQPVADITSPSQQAERREASVLLADALGDLPSHYREVIVLRHLEGFSFAEVAERMGRTVDSVKNLWARALAKLRVQMGNGE